MFSKLNRKITLFMLDIFFVVVSYFIVIYIARDDWYSVILTDQTLYSILFSVILIIGGLYCINFYSYIWAYTGVREYTICFSVGSLLVIFETLASVILKNIFLPYKYILVAGFFSICFVTGIRAAAKIMYMYFESHVFDRRKETKNLLIIGAGNAAGLAVREIMREPQSEYNIVGLIDDSMKKQNCMVYGVKVIGRRGDIKRVCEEKKVAEIIIAIPSLDKADRIDIINRCSETGCKVKIMPNTLKMFDKIKLTKDVRDIEVEDLLGRDVIKLDNGKIAEYVNGQTILVTGGGGSIGSELCRQIASYNPKRLIIVDIYENNAYDIQLELREKYEKLKLSVLIASVRDLKKLDEIFDKYKPDIVFHAAAHKHVPLMEDSPGEAIKNNVKGTLNTCICADKYNVKKFVLISTDKAVNPTNVMGASKRLCEMIIQSINEVSKTDFAAVRFGNVLGSNGSVIPVFKKQIKNGGPITVTHKDITRFFMTIPEASQLVLEAATFAKGGEIFVLDMGEPVKIYDLAVNLIKLAGYEPNKDVEIIVTGLRQGEKLYEELLMSEEGLSETPNKKIYVAKPSEFSYDEIKESVDELYHLACNGVYDKLIERLKEVVPTYREVN